MRILPKRSFSPRKVAEEESRGRPYSLLLETDPQNGVVPADLLSIKYQNSVTLGVIGSQSSSLYVYKQGIFRLETSNFI